MPDGVNSLYPQPPAPQQGMLSGDPSKVIGLVNELNRNRLFNDTYSAVSQQPAAALAGQNIANDTAQIQQQAIASRAAHGIMAGYLAGMKDPKSDDVHSAAALAARSLPGVATKYPDIIPAASDVVLKNPKGIKYGVGVLQNSQLSPESASGLVTGTPSPSGAPRQMTVPESNLAGGRETGLAPGEQGLAEAAAERASKLQLTASTSPQYHADLENLRQESKVLGSVGGPTTETEKKINQIASRFGFTVSMSPEQLKSVESFDKIANQISLNQSQFFHGSDAGLHTVVGANPSTSMSQYGREGVIDMLHGNQDAIDVARKAWLKARANGVAPKDYDLFAERIGQEIDPRVFQFNRLSRENQQTFLHQLDPDEIKTFEEKYKSAIDKKWVKPLKKPDDAK